jgi:hypothetical protein
MVGAPLSRAAVMKGGSAYAGAASRYLIFDNDKDETNEFQT